MYGPGHFCLLIYANDKWKENFKNKLFEQASSEFLKLLEPSSEAEAYKIGWDEIPRESLFNPENMDSLNYSCSSCSAIYKNFLERKGINEGLILFSHNVLYDTELKKFFTYILRDKRIKKIGYYELEDLPIDEASKIAQTLSVNRIKISEFRDLLDKKQFQNGIFYEITRDKFL